MSNPTLFQTRWNLGALALCNLLALGLLCFWLWPFGQILCLTFDDWLFHLLNRPLADNPIWLHIWAVASLRPFDAVVGVIMLSLLIKGNWVFEAAHWGQDDCIGGLLLARLALGWGYCTPYPTRMIEGLLRLSASLFSLLQRLPLVSRLSIVRG